MQQNRIAAALGARTKPPQIQSALAQLLSSVTPQFTREGPDLYGRAFQHNQQFAKPGPYQTPLAAPLEQRFRQWVASNHVPFDPRAKTVDYDMRGYFAQNGAAPHANGQHFPDTFKTPYDTTFSGESKYAKPGTPLVWQGNTLVNSRTGQVVFKAGGR